LEVFEMTRKMIDCRNWPGPCSLAISGLEVEVLEAQPWHMASVHGAGHGPELREQIRTSLKDVNEKGSAQ
jgi:hypothetical protein